MGPFARLAGTSARLALGQLVLLGVALEALPNDRSWALISKNSASVPAIERDRFGAEGCRLIPPTVARWRLSLLDWTGTQPETTGGSTGGPNCLIAI